MIGQENNEPEASEPAESEPTEQPSDPKKAKRDAKREAKEAKEAKAREAKEAKEAKAREAKEAKEAKAREAKEAKEAKAREAKEAKEAKAREVRKAKEAKEAKAREAKEAKEAKAREAKEAKEAKAREAKEAKEAKEKEKEVRAAEGADEELPKALSETRFSRLRKKREMPGGLWLKCESCSKMIYRKALEERGRVCPNCEFHFSLPGKERIRMLLDEGSWKERFSDLRSLDRLEFKDKIPYLEKVASAEKKTGQAEALICGTGDIEGRPIVLAVLDFSFMGGSMGEVVGEKIALAAELAHAERKPLVIVTSSGGARMHEGVISLMQMAKTSAALAEFHDAGGFSICLMAHPTTGGVTASFASVCDLTVAEPGALIGFAGPRVIANTLKTELPPGFQRAEFLLEKGQLDLIVRRDELRGVFARLIDFGMVAHADYGPHT